MTYGAIALGVADSRMATGPFSKETRKAYSAWRDAEIEFADYCRKGR